MQDLAVRGDLIRVSVETGKCVAAGQCVLLAQEVFDQREEDGAGMSPKVLRAWRALIATGSLRGVALAA
jgi:hypothetical protein